MSEEIQQALRKLKLRMSSGEIDEETYHRQRDLILADLSPQERAAVGTTGVVSSTPAPRSGVSFGPSGVGMSNSSSGLRLGPSGARGSGVRTSIPSLSDLELAPGTVLLGQWKLGAELGRGGFGAVFAAEEMHLHERQAVKVLDPAMVAKEELLGRFRREVSVMRKLVHPRIVRVYDYREDLEQTVALISMELVSGGSVRHLIAAAKQRGIVVPLPLALSILGQTLEALSEAHRQGVIHRDVTPGNVLLAGGSVEQLLAEPGHDPQVKLVDFGIAGLVERSELSQKSQVLGTVAYVAPEILDPAGEITPAADVYGAGAMAYELLTGQLPLARFQAPRELRAELSPDLDAFVMSLLEREATRRPSANGAWSQVRELPSSEEVDAPPPPLAAPPVAAVPAPARSAPASPAQLSMTSLPKPDAAAAPPARSGPSRGLWIATATIAGAVLLAGVWFLSQQKGGETRGEPAAASSAPRPVDPAEERRLAEARRQDAEQARAASAEREKAAQEAREKERRGRYLDSAAVGGGGPSALAVSSGGKRSDTLTSRLNEAIQGSPGLFRPAFVNDGLFAKAVDGDHGVLSDLGLADYPGEILLVREEIEIGADSLARDLSVATVTLSGRLFRGAKTAMVQGQGKKPDFDRGRAVDKARAEAVEDLVAALGRAVPR